MSWKLRQEKGSSGGSDQEHVCSESSSEIRPLEKWGWEGKGRVLRKEGLRVL